MTDHPAGGTGTTSYLLDPTGNRLRRRTVAPGRPTGYSQVIEEREGGRLLAGTVYGLAFIAQFREGQFGLDTGDGQSVRQLVLPGGGVAAAYRYDAFGGAAAAAGAAANPVGYRGERFDATLGQYYLRARFYDPATGRFTAMDPFAGDQRRPQAYHEYGYANADPVNQLDPAGLFGFGSISLGGFGGQLARGFAVPAIISVFAGVVGEFLTNVAWNRIPADIRNHLDNFDSNSVSVLLAGIQSSGTVKVGGSLGVAADAGFEAAVSPKTEQWGVFGVIGGHVEWDWSTGIGADRVAGSVLKKKIQVSEDLQVYAGMAWNAPTSEKYAGRSVSITIPMSWAIKKVAAVAGNVIKGVAANERTLRNLSSYFLRIPPGQIDSQLVDAIGGRITKGVDAIVGAIQKSSFVEKLGLTVFWSPEEEDGGLGDYGFHLDYNFAPWGKAKDGKYRSVEMGYSYTEYLLPFDFGTMQRVNSRFH